MLSERLHGKNKEVRGICPNCGGERWTRPSRVGVLCRSCFLEQFRWNRSPNWKGGRIRSKAGYVYIWMPDHPQAQKNGYINEARLVAEDVLGRLLLRDEDTHHINGIRDDNRPKNIKVLGHGEHTVLTNRLYRKAAYMAKFRWVEKELVGVGR